MASCEINTGSSEFELLQMNLRKKATASRRKPETFVIKKSSLRIICTIMCFVHVVLVCSVIILSIMVNSNNGFNSGFTETTVKTTPPPEPASRMTFELYGVLQDGRNVTRYTLRNDDMRVDILDFGGIVTKIEVPDKDGNIADILLGFDSLQEYDRENVLFGAVLGRYANLIAGNRFRLDGVLYILDVDGELGINGSNGRGFSKRLWDSHIEDDTLVLTYNSPDGEGGFPGNVNVSVTYHLTEENELVINYRATTSKPTVINLTNRLFFNLNGHASGDVRDHIVRIVADHYTPLDKDQVPTGEIAPVRGTMYDTRTSFYLGPRLPQVPGDRGFDINFAFGNSGWDRHMASVSHDNGRTIDVYSTEPGLQFNTGYYLQGIMGKGGVVYKQYGGLLLEAQHYPNSPNEPIFPITMVLPDTPYMQTTKYVFGDSREKTPLASTVAPNTTLNKSISVTQKGRNVVSNGISSLLSLAVVFNVLVTVVVILGLGCLVYRKRNSIRAFTLVRQTFGKTKQRTTTVDEQSDDYLHSLHLIPEQDLDRDPEYMCRVQNIVCSDKEPNSQITHLTTAMAEQTKDGPNALDLVIASERDPHPEQLSKVQVQACINEDPKWILKERDTAVAMQPEDDQQELEQYEKHLLETLKTNNQIAIPNIKTPWLSFGTHGKLSLEIIRERDPHPEQLSKEQVQACLNEDPIWILKERDTAVATQPEDDPEKLEQYEEYMLETLKTNNQKATPNIKTPWLSFGTHGKLSLEIIRERDPHPEQLSKEQVQACLNEDPIWILKERDTAVATQPEDDPEKLEQYEEYMLETLKTNNQKATPNIKPLWLSFGTHGKFILEIISERVSCLRVEESNSKTTEVRQPKNNTQQLDQDPKQKKTKLQRRRTN